VRHAIEGGEEQSQLKEINDPLLGVLKKISDIDKS
jgi:hypothetical protein